MTEEQNRALTDKFMLRFPDGMRERIKLLADSAGRSMNSEIIGRLQRTLDEDLVAAVEGGRKAERLASNSALEMIRAGIRQEMRSIKAELLETRELDDGRRQFTYQEPRESRSSDTEPLPDAFPERPTDPAEHQAWMEDNLRRFAIQLGFELVEKNKE